MRSPIYWHPAVYRVVMKMLYGKQHDATYRKAAEHIPPGSVLELCCGDGYFARFIGRDRYKGLEFNRMFVRIAKQQGLAVQVADVRATHIPQADTIVLLNSLYQFIPHEEKLLRKMLRSAHKCVIIMEPIQNLAQSKNRIVAKISHWLTDPGTGSMEQRCTKQRLAELARTYHGTLRSVGKNVLLIFSR